MQKDEHGNLKFVSGAVLFPQRWSLIEKIGMDMSRIHQPVPLYADSISRPVNTFMERLQTSRPYERCNWTVWSFANIYCLVHVLLVDFNCRL